MRITHPLQPATRHCQSTLKSPPQAFRREAVIPVQDRRESQHDHRLHNAMENSTYQKRRFILSPTILITIVAPVTSQQTVRHFTQAGWAESWASSTQTFRNFMPTPSSSSSTDVISPELDSFRASAVGVGYDKSYVQSLARYCKCSCATKHEGVRKSIKKKIKSP